MKDSKTKIYFRNKSLYPLRVQRRIKTGRYFPGKRIKIPILIICTLLLFSFISAGYPPSTHPADIKDAFPRPQGHVTDHAGLLSSQSVRHLDDLIIYMKQKTGAEVAVVTLKTISPYTIEDYAVRLFENWGIGQKDKDNGILILVAVQERKVRIEVGYGLEGAITDGTAGEIIREIITPAFKQGRFDQGLVAGTESVLRLIAKEYTVDLPESITFRTNTGIKSKKSTKGGGLFSFLIFLFFLIILFKSGLWPLLFLGFPGGGWSRGGGGFGGGFGGFGGGMSGGGGASGGW